MLIFISELKLDFHIAASNKQVIFLYYYFFHKDSYIITVKKQSLLDIDLNPLIYEFQSNKTISRLINISTNYLRDSQDVLKVT